MDHVTNRGLLRDTCLGQVPLAGCLRGGCLVCKEPETPNDPVVDHR